MSGPKEMHLPETFHRLKRTVLLLSAALIVLGLAEPVAKTGLHLTLVELSIASELANWLLWLSALYYLIGFCLEVSSAARLNSEAIRGEGLREFEMHMRQLGSKAVSEMAFIDQALQSRTASLAEWVEKLDENIQPVALSLSDDAISSLAERLAVTSSEAAPILPHGFRYKEDIRQALSGALNDMRHPTFQIQQQVQMLTANLPGWGEAVKHLAEKQVDLYETFSAHADRMKRLHPLITGERKLSFYWWELGGAVAAFGSASFLGWPPGRFLTDYFVTLWRAQGG